MTLFFAEEVRGSRRWLKFYFLNFQPSEFLKPFYILFLSEVFSNKKHTSFFDYLLIFLPIFLIFKQPDLGNVIVYGFIFLSVIFFAFSSLKIHPLLFFLFLLFPPFFWVSLREYQRFRLVNFFKGLFDFEKFSYNSIQSIVAVGSGKVFGRGLGLGTQSKLYFLPESYTDFAFASFVEQFGFFGGMILILIYFFLFVILFKKLIFFSYGSFAFLFIASVISYFFVHLMINVGMNLGILPVTGITLPFISYGGSSLVSVMMILGLTLSL